MHTVTEKMRHSLVYKIVQWFRWLDLFLVQIRNVTTGEVYGAV